MSGQLSVIDHGLLVFISFGFKNKCEISCCHTQGGGGYDTKKATIRGGWDKCLGPFDHYQAKAFGIDVWDCHSNNCYIRKDYNGGRSTSMHVGP